MKTVGGFRKTRYQGTERTQIGGLVGGSGVQPRAHGEDGGLSGVRLGKATDAPIA